MTMNFSAARWKTVETDASLWWEGKLNRPLIQATVGGLTPDRPPPRMTRSVNRHSIHDFSVPPEDIVDRWDWDLATKEWLGDSFPNVWLDFGPGVLAVFLGGQAEPRLDTVWFHPARHMELKDIRFRYDGENRLARRIKDIARIAGERWKGMVQVGMTDLGGNLDILSTFRPGEKLLFDLYDDPDEVKRLTWEAHNAWMDAFHDFNAVLRKTNRGYTAWTPIFSREPYYMLQCDFCYMIGPAMFDEFVRPELAATCRKLPHPFYHLDGPGQLPHLDSLLSIPELKGVQWVPGAGNPPPDKWSQVYEKILGRGKLTQVWDGAHLDAIRDAVGTVRGVVATLSTGRDQRSAVEATLERYGV